MSDKMDKLNKNLEKLAFLRSQSSTEFFSEQSDTQFLICESCNASKVDDGSSEPIRHDDNCLLVRWIKELEEECVALQE